MSQRISMRKRMKIMIAILALASAVSAESSPPREAVARIGDQAIYDDDLLPSIAGQLWQLKNQEYDLKTKALVNVVNQRLLEAAAKSKGLSTDAFLEQTVDRRGGVRRQFARRPPLPRCSARRKTAAGTNSPPICGGRGARLRLMKYNPFCT